MSGPSCSTILNTWLPPVVNGDCSNFHQDFHIPINRNREREEDIPVFLKVWPVSSTLLSLTPYCPEPSHMATPRCKGG